MKLKTMTILGAALIALAACNTVQGVGQDIQDGGQALERSATN